MNVKADCCCVVNGNHCDCGGVYQVTLDQLERTVAAKRAKKQGELLYDHFVTCDAKMYWVCAEHAYDIIKAHLAETYEVASGKARMERRDLIKEILWCTGTHENQDPGQAEKLAAHIVESNAPPKPDTPRRVSRPTGDHPVVGDDKVMKLRKLFDRALPFIHVQSFTYVLLITMLRSVLILNGIFEYGRHVWHGDKEGTDILRFCAVLYTVVGAPGIELLRGGAVPKDAQQTVDGIYDLRLKNLTCIPGARQIRNYIATPFRIQDMLRASEPLVDAALAFFGGGQIMLGATFDCVYGETYFEVVKDLDQKYVLLGGSSVDGLVSAALDADRAAGLDKLEAKDHATKLMTVVLHLIVGKDKEKRPKATLVAVIPIHDETGVIISNVYLELRRLIFARGSWLVFGGGDGAVPNLVADAPQPLRARAAAITARTSTESYPPGPFPTRDASGKERPRRVPAIGLLVVTRCGRRRGRVPGLWATGRTGGGSASLGPGRLPADYSAGRNYSTWGWKVSQGQLRELRGLT